MKTNWEEGCKAFYSNANFYTHRMITRSAYTTTTAWEAISISAIRQISIEIVSPIQEEL